MLKFSVELNQSSQLTRSGKVCIYCFDIFILPWATSNENKSFPMKMMKNTNLRIQKSYFIQIEPKIKLNHARYDSNALSFKTTFMLEHGTTAKINGRKIKCENHV